MVSPLNDARGRVRTSERRRRHAPDLFSARGNAIAIVISERQQSNQGHLDGHGRRLTAEQTADSCFMNGDGDSDAA